MNIIIEHSRWQQSRNCLINTKQSAQEVRSEFTRQIQMQPDIAIRHKNLMTTAAPIKKNYKNSANYIPFAANGNNKCLLYIRVHHQIYVIMTS